MNPSADARRCSFYISYYLLIENAEGYVLIALYSFIYLYACSSHYKKSFKPNRMKFGGMICYYPGTIWLDFDIYFGCHQASYLRIENAEGNVLIAVRVIRISQKILNRIAWNLVGWLVIIRGPFENILGLIGSKVNVKVMERSTSSFYHIAPSISIQLACN